MSKGQRSESSRRLRLEQLLQPTRTPFRPLVHRLDQGIDVLLPVTIITTLDVMLELARSEASSRVRQLERPQEVAGLLEGGTNCDDLVDQIFHAHDAEFTKIVFNQLVIGESDALLVNLAVAAFIDELADGLQVGVSIGDVGINNRKHLLGSLGETDKDTVIELEQSKELHDLARLWSDLVDTG